MHPIAAIRLIRQLAAEHHLEVRIWAARPFTPCQQDILDLLADSPGPMTTTMILESLERRGDLHGERTVRGALAALVRSGDLLSSRRAPYGYRLPPRPLPADETPSDSDETPRAS